MTAFLPIFLAVLVVMVAFLVARRYSAARRAARDAAPEDDRLELGAERDADGGFLLHSEGGGGLRVVFGSARASAGPGAAPLAVGEATLEAPDRERGRVFLADVAAWLGEAPPAARAAPGPLAPQAVRYLRLGDDGGGVQRHKLILPEGGDAEIYLDVAGDGRRAWLGEKDAAYREGVLAALARLVDGG